MQSTPVASCAVLTPDRHSMIKLIGASLASLLIAGSMLQTATAGERIAKRHYDITRTIRNANASLAPYDASPVFARRDQQVSGQDGQPSRSSFYLPYMQGSCWDLGTCD
jgi:hypothetical protein